MPPHPGLSLAGLLLPCPSGYLLKTCLYLDSISRTTYIPGGGYSEGCRRNGSSYDAP